VPAFYWGGAAASSSNAMSPGMRPTSVPNGILTIQLFGHIRHGLKLGGLCRAPVLGSWPLSNTIWPGPRPTSVQSSILLKAAYCSIQSFDHNRHGSKITGVLWLGGAGSPSNTMRPGPMPNSVLSGILIHPAVCPL